MPRTILLVPINRPSGTAVSAASTKAPNTRSRLHARCWSSGRPPCILPFHACTAAFHTAAGEGRNSGGIQALAVMPHQAKKRMTTVAMVTPSVLPLPGRGYTLAAGSTVVANGNREGVAVSLQLVSAATGDDEEGVMIGAHSISGRVVHKLQQAFAPGDEVGRGLDCAGVPRGQVVARKRQRELVCDAARSRRHDDHARAEEQRLFNAVRDEKNGLAGTLPELDQQLLYRLARQGVKRTHGLVHQ